jgi:hypothetical protein
VTYVGAAPFALFAIAYSFLTRVFVPDVVMYVGATPFALFARAKSFLTRVFVPDNS